jgi:predicted nucleotidyltransferase
MEKQLDDLTRKLTDALGDRIVSVILYGSAAAGDWQERASDLNILCVLKAVTTSEMKLADPVFQWWMKLGNLPPVLMTEAEVTHSTDCFPIEFHDIKERHRVLIGRDIAAGLEIDFTYYRAFVEKELRSKQIRLRQKSVELLGQHDRLVKLMTDSISTFCALGRHALILGKRETRWKKQEILAAISDATGSALGAANELLSIRESGKKPAAGEVLALLDEYLREIDVIVGFVDSLHQLTSENEY